MVGFEIVLAALYKKSNIRSVQRGIASSAGNITISPVKTEKTMILSKSKGSAGYVAARGSGTVRFNLLYGMESTAIATGYAYQNSTFTLSGGSTDLTVKEYSARLVSSTTIYCDGPVEWQVIEFN